jgi:signal transduction histidine kinase
MLSIIIVIIVVYHIFLQLQLRNINRQLKKRLIEHTRQPISLELMNKELSTLVVNINKCLKAEEQLRLEGIREEKRFKEMIANISHDLRTPVTAIKGYQQLMEKGTLSEEQQQKLAIAQKYTNELGDLIEHFFEYSFLLNIDPKHNMERINLTDLVTEFLAESVVSFEDNNMAIQLNETEPVYVLADREMTTRIIQNLIRNCLIHSSGDITVQVMAKKCAIISFKNPVKKEAELDPKRLFDRFYTADKARSKSTGLGLSIVKLLAEQMGGNASASLQNGEIDIRVELPLWK